ncbi:AMP-binding protein [Agrobacterium tumefaciens]|uniref:AMP-binding protein n=1 Tax=Agrobacterium tumefaciens TaxID=358 RepID=UPI001573B89C|nr:AMP-binding protein [Agrobacterium tumefaciens]NTC82588.1 AMP-binding protein [Agrobacterium tumefaciens]NTD11411.1 AMP-binding protein [Agrobacterium tumefaciens]NTD86732.1 AMP-binding protein [Agrobacterium tumefaciens]NTD91459.1 AMP-binding protein [Agrobacterium tumefaciens]NTD96930.1 AMP-binding protein [Agrobacterium tumefaciens]
MKIMAIVKGSTEPPLLPYTIGGMLRKIGVVHGGNQAIISVPQNKSLTYAELDAEADRVAASLLSLGVRSGDRVAIWSPNCCEWLVAHYGAARVGAVVVTVNPALRNDEVRHVLQDAGVSVLFMAGRFRAFSFIDALAAIRDTLSQLKHVIMLNSASGPGLRSWDEFLCLGQELDMSRLTDVESSVSIDDPCSLQYTSGTTGKPKGALLTHRGLLNNGYFVGERQHLSPEDKICLPVPFFHCFGLVLGALGALSHASALVLPGEGFDVVECLTAIEQARCTAFYGVPMMFISILTHPEFDAYDVSTLRTGCMGGASCPLTTMKDAVHRMNMREVTIAYGMTETSPISFQSVCSDDDEIRVSTVGSIHPHLEAKVVDPATGVILNMGQAGELCIRGYSVMKGYWRNEASTAEAIDADGWMRTGDLGVLDENGYLKIVGRLKDMIIRGGENIYPREVEEFLLTLPAVAEAYVFGVPDDRYGEEVCAWIKLREHGSLTEHDIREKCRGRIATYKIPRHIRLVTGFPMTSSGKVQRAVMKAEEEALLRESAVGS